jgi:FXSXX-COOH protein
MDEERPVEYGAGLIDVTGLSLSELDGLYGSAPLDLALRRLVEEVDSGPVAGFQSAL